MNQDCSFSYGFSHTAKIISFMKIKYARMHCPTNKILFEKHAPPLPSSEAK